MSIPKSIDNAGAVALVLVSLMVLFSFLNGIPWAAKADVVETKAVILKNTDRISRHSEELSALRAQREDVDKRLARIEAKLDQLLSVRVYETVR